MGVDGLNWKGCKQEGKCFLQAFHPPVDKFDDALRRVSSPGWNESIRWSDGDLVLERYGNFLDGEWKSAHKKGKLSDGQRIVLENRVKYNSQPFSAAFVVAAGQEAWWGYNKFRQTWAEKRGGLGSLLGAVTAWCEMVEHFRSAEPALLGQVVHPF